MDNVAFSTSPHCVMSLEDHFLPGFEQDSSGQACLTLHGDMALITAQLADPITSEVVTPVMRLPIPPKHKVDVPPHDSGIQGSLLTMWYGTEVVAMNIGFELGYPFHVTYTLDSTSLPDGGTSSMQ